MNEIGETLMELPESEPVYAEGVIEEWAMDEEKSFIIEKVSNTFVVSGSLVDEILFKINPEDHQSMVHFQKLLIDFGIIKALRAKGVKSGDTVVLNDEEFDFED